MTRTYQITRGNQYDGQRGYSIQCGGLYGWGAISERMDGTVGPTFGGRVAPPDSDMDVLEVALRATLADGQARTVVSGTPKPAPAPEAGQPEWRSARGLTLTEEMDSDDTIY